MIKRILTKNLVEVRNAFLASGYDIRLVGGAVRDILSGTEPKDIDLCTDANPEEQVQIYKKYGFGYHETGLQHGTITVVNNGEVYEVTSLRTEGDYDGRRPGVVSYTRDWELDLGRRDLTINSMAMTFDGDLIDPFNGSSDLADGRVVFVGSPEQRINEDYLRILRWFRFHGRIGQSAEMDPYTLSVVSEFADGLDAISRERVWMEMSKIIVGRMAVDMVKAIQNAGVGLHIDLKSNRDFGMLDHAINTGHTSNPVTAMVALLGGSHQEVANIASVWKWSSTERNLGVFLAKNYGNTNYIRLVSHDGYSVEHVCELARLQGSAEKAEFLASFDFPVFPVQGRDLIENGMTPGPAIGNLLRSMKSRWAEVNYVPSKEDLIKAYVQQP